ncbi:unnamed protein product [Cyprideis torosa]|uniref:Uncharacterized protein n=1 Tax=Cyprideis torosa TaxID=163714 RepID=A0A7R8ZRF1_9CRUS|nr:unnamed protein product [Cyprideis torosa]CAG0898764.1 unnamed protein product [Cyprideis torosa]
MLKSDQKSTTPSGSPQSPESPPHWTQEVKVSTLLIISSGEDSPIGFEVEGGSDYGEFARVGAVSSEAVFGDGGVCQGEVILEVQGQNVVGFTQKDLTTWIRLCADKNDRKVEIRTLPPGSISTDLRSYLSTRFRKGSPDHTLQNGIRDNLYQRTVPVTTRPQREGETNGVDYTFLSIDDFRDLEREGKLLESGIYEEKQQASCGVCT